MCSLAPPVTTLHLSKQAGVTLKDALFSINTQQKTEQTAVKYGKNALKPLRCLSIWRMCTSCRNKQQKLQLFVETRALCHNDFLLKHLKVLSK